MRFNDCYNSFNLSFRFSVFVLSTLFVNAALCLGENNCDRVGGKGKGVHLILIALIACGYALRLISDR